MNEWYAVELSLLKRNISAKRIEKFRVVYVHLSGRDIEEKIINLPNPMSEMSEVHVY